MTVLYPELVGAMAKRCIKRNTVANSIGISPRTLYAKLVGETDFTLSEANAIHAMFFPDLDKEELFRKTDGTCRSNV